MTLNRSKNDGRLYGTSLVILTRDTGVPGEDIEQHIGYTAPFGGILVQRFNERSFVEESFSWWEQQGFEITEPPILLEARRLSRQALPNDRKDES